MKNVKRKRSVSVFFLILSLFAAAVFVTGCREEMTVDRVWDGNYLYCDNYRSKTNGEDEAYIVDEISGFDETFTYSQSECYRYVGDYFFLGGVFKDANDKDAVLIVKHNLKKKTNEIICRYKEFDGELYTLDYTNYFVIKDDKLLFSALFKNGEKLITAYMSLDINTNKSTPCYYAQIEETVYPKDIRHEYRYENYLLLRVDGNGNYVSYNLDNGKSIPLTFPKNTSFACGYGLVERGNTYYGVSLADGTEKEILSGGEYSVGFDRETVDKDNLILFTTFKDTGYEEFSGNFCIYNSLYCYNVETGRLYCLISDNSDSKTYSFIGGGYFIEEKVVKKSVVKNSSDTESEEENGDGETLSESESVSESDENKYEDRYEKVNAKLYKFSGDGKVSYVTDLVNGGNLENAYYGSDGLIRFSYRGLVWHDKQYDPSTGKKSKATYHNYDEYSFVNGGAKCGDYYYLNERMGWFSTASVRRYNIKTKEQVYVQRRGVTPGTYTLGEEEIDLVLPY